MESKAELFQQAFFLLAPPTDLADIKHASYPKPISFPPIELYEIIEAICKTGLNKALGNDGILNQL